jgi:hypothetical protein
MICQSIRMERIKSSDNFFVLLVMNVNIVFLWCRPKKIDSNFNEAGVLEIDNASFKL